ncbi:uncharacterized protein LOC136092125 [Hydra vulgaris]|uniref:Uncharacterized protein LOC136092125 n=1 Tax=Hydra vulgaris TaxID=6087 RepID=A0ABM4DN02_HYDVU
MGKPQFNFKISAGRKRSRTKTKPETRAEATVYRKDIRAKENQISEAVDWCTENKKRGQAALKTGKFPLIKDRGTIDRRLDGKVKNVKKEHLRVLHPDDEKEIVCFIRNKNRAHQGLSKKEVSEIILDVLKIRDHLNKNGKGGRKFLKLSPSGKMALQNRKLGKSFWRRWHAEHDDIVIKRQGRVKMNRALNCTREMATAHLDALADELIACRIMKNYKKIKKDVWVGDIATERVFNHDETPQFINYGVDGTTARLVYAGKGETCKKMIRENRESITINPFVSISGVVSLCQVIFAGKGITSQMTPQKAVSNIKNFLREKQINLFVSPPDTTGVTQLLDQAPNQQLHRYYNNTRDELYSSFQTINRERFMNILGTMWNNWASAANIVSAAK